MSKHKGELKRRLQEIYDKVPDAGCKGLCHAACGPLTMAAVEMKRLVDAVGSDAACYDPHDFLCGALDRKTHRCTAYSVRPLICRLYGAAEGLECPHGCRPERLLTRQEALALAQEVHALSRELGFDDRDAPAGESFRINCAAGRNEALVTLGELVEQVKRRG